MHRGRSAPPCHADDGQQAPDQQCAEAHDDRGQGRAGQGHRRAFGRRPPQVHERGWKGEDAHEQGQQTRKRDNCRGALAPVRVHDGYGFP